MSRDLPVDNPYLPANHQDVGEEESFPGRRFRLVKLEKPRINQFGDYMTHEFKKNKDFEN